MGLFKKRVTDPAEIERLQTEIAAMGARLNATDAANSQLDHTVRGITDRLDASTPPPPAPPPPAPPPTAEALDSSGLDDLNERMDILTSRVDEGRAGAVDPAEIERVGAEVERIGRRLDEVDARITSISTELANQITELSGELDTNGSVPGEALVDELRDAQTRLAGEQARYQIAFRQDLADLAERLKRT